MNMITIPTLYGEITIEKDQIRCVIKINKCEIDQTDTSWSIYVGGSRYKLSEEQYNLLIKRLTS